MYYADSEKVRLVDTRFVILLHLMVDKLRYQEVHLSDT